MSSNLLLYAVTFVLVAGGVLYAATPRLLELSAVGRVVTAAAVAVSPLIIYAVLRVSGVGSHDIGAASIYALGIALVCMAVSGIVSVYVSFSGRAYDVLMKIAIASLCLTYIALIVTLCNRWL